MKLACIVKLDVWFELVSSFRKSDAVCVCSFDFSYLKYTLATVKTVHISFPSLWNRACVEQKNVRSVTFAVHVYSEWFTFEHSQPSLWKSGKNDSQGGNNWNYRFISHLCAHKHAQSQTHRKVCMKTNTVMQSGVVLSRGDNRRC